MPDSTPEQTPSSLASLPWHRQVVSASPLAICALMATARERAEKGEGPAVPPVQLTLKSGASFAGVVVVAAEGDGVLLEGEAGIVAVAWADVAAIAVPHADVVKEVVTDGAVEAAISRETLTTGHLVTRAQELTANIGVKLTLDPALATDQTTLIGMERLMIDVAEVVGSVRQRRGVDALHNIIDVVWLGHGGRPGTFIAKRRLEVRARFQAGRAGRLTRQALEQAIEAVL